MEDVDSLLIISLREVPSKASSSITSINDLENPEVLIPVTISMLNLITHSDIPPEIPLTLSTKYKLCMKLAEMIKGLGYTSELNFNAFLYPNLKDIRNIISCLLEKIPKEDAQVTVLDETSSQLYWRKMKDIVKNWASENWKAPFDKVQQLEFRKTIELYDGNDLKPELGEAWDKYIQERIPVKVRISKAAPLSLLTTSVQALQTIQLKNSDNEFVLKTASTQKEAPTIDKLDITESKLPSLLEILERGTEQQEEIVGNFTLETEFTQVEQEILNNEEDEISEESENPANPENPENPEGSENVENSELTETTEAVEVKKKKKKEPVVETRQDEIDKLELQLQDLYEKVQETEAMITTARAELSKFSQAMKIFAAENETLKKDLEQKHKLASALSDGSSIAIEEEIKELEKRLTMMQKEWTEYKQPIIEEAKEKEKKIEKMKESYTDKIEEIKQMKSEMVEIAEEAGIKEEIFEMLKLEDAKGSSSMNRNAFIKKITEIISKLKSQKKNISKVIKDINSMKKSVELSRESLKRVDSGTEDLVFQDAKKNNSSKVIYKLLVDLRENYDNLIRTVEEQYKLQTKISDFEIRIESVLARNSKHDIERLRSDLEKIKSEH